MSKYGKNFLDKPMSTIMYREKKACQRCGWFPYHGLIYCEGCGQKPTTVKNMSIKDCLLLARNRTTTHGEGSPDILGLIIMYFERQGEPGWGINSHGRDSSDETRQIYKEAKRISKN